MHRQPSARSRRAFSLALICAPVVAAACGEEPAVLLDAADLLAEPEAGAPDPRQCDVDGETRCVDATVLASCVAGQWVEGACPGATRCDAGACLPPVCDPDDPAEARCLDAVTAEGCPPPGTRRVAAPCTEGPCVDGACTVGCAPGARRCDGAAVVECGADFVERAVETCAGAAECAGGRCLSACEASGLKRGHVGCSFAAADLPNDDSALDNVFAFAFANASATVAASVTVAAPWGQEDTLTVPPGEVGLHPLPVPRLLSWISGPLIAPRAFFITSDAPIAAVMFNPLQRYDADASATVATNDASLLIPTEALGLDHLAMTWTDPGALSRPPFVTVVALAADTDVEVTSRETIVLPVPPFAVPRGTPTTIRLQRGDVLNLEPVPLPGQRTDMAGTRVRSLNHPVAVFSGNRCARVPDAGRFCDHVETQLPPIGALGTEHAIAPFADRGGALDHVRVVATADGTTLVFDPPRADVGPLAAGAVHTFTTDEPVVMTSNQPVLVGQFMASQSTTSADGPFGQSVGCPPEIGGSCIGDPALVLAAAASAWRRDVVFLVPGTYRHTFVNVIVAAGAEVLLGETPLDLSVARPIGASGLVALTLPVEAGRHELRASAPVSAVVYGYDHNISFAYQAGLDFPLPPAP
jgi:hypothetical protein